MLYHLTMPSVTDSFKDTFIILGTASNHLCSQQIQKAVFERNRGLITVVTTTTGNPLPVLLTINNYYSNNSWLLYNVWSRLQGFLFAIAIPGKVLKVSNNNSTTWKEYFKSVDLMCRYHKIICPRLRIHFLPYHHLDSSQDTRRGHSVYTGKYSGIVWGSRNSPTYFLLHQALGHALILFL